MHILFLTQIIPYPPDAGPRVKTWNVLRYLAFKGHQISLVSFARPDETKYIPNLEKVCDAVYTIPIQRSKLKDIRFFGKSLTTGRPFIIERDEDAAMRDLINELICRKNIHYIHADQLSMAQYAVDLGVSAHNHKPKKHSNLKQSHVPITIFDAHNAVWTILDSMVKSYPRPFRPIIQFEANRTKKYEGEVVRHFDHTLAVTEFDRQNLLEATQLSNHREVNQTDINVIPISVDTEHSQPINRDPKSHNILTLGTLHYPPNADGIRWFIREIFPLIVDELHDVTLTIVGKNPPPDILEFQNRYPNQIQVTGYVPDLSPYMENTGVVVIPVRSGSGMRVRILEGLAFGMPMVTTNIGCEGISVRDEEELLISDAPSEFAQSCVRILTDASLATSLSTKARAKAVKEYDWKVVLKKMDQIYSSRATLVQLNEG